MSEVPRRLALFGVTLAPLVATGLPSKEAARRAALCGASLPNARDYGAFGDGRKDDTAAIEAAFAAGGGAIYFPPGTYIYNGPGLSDVAPTVVGAGRNETSIVLGPDSYLLDISVQMQRLDVREFQTWDGKGIIRYTRPASNVILKYSVMNCEFNRYSECAIASDAKDMPYWLIKNCFFDGKDTLNTIGVALGGGTDQCVIDSCSFVRNRVHIKVRSGNNMQISNCDFLQYSTINTNGPRASVWVVPAATTNSGPGFVLRNSKFGNESLVAGDYKVLYADEGSGVTNGVRFPNLGADSNGYIVGHRITNCIFMNIGGADHSVIYSTTPNVRAIAINDCYDDGSAYFLEFRTPPIAPDALNTNSVFGPISGVGISGAAGITRLSNAVGVGYVDDPAGVIQDTAVVRGSGSSAGYRNLLSAEAGEFGTSDSTVARATDVFGGSDAATYTFTTANGHTRRVLDPFTPDVPVFVEFDLKSPGDSNALSQLGVYIRDEGSHYHWSRVVGVPSAKQGWVTYQFYFVPRTVGVNHRLYFACSGGRSNQAVVVGRPRVYHGNASQLGGQRPSVAAAATTPEETQALVNDLRAKLIALGVIS